MKILSINDIKRDEWSRLVSSSTTGTWFQTPEAYDFFASMPELFKPFAIGICNLKSETINAQSSLRAVCVGYVTVEKSAIKQMMTRRAIVLKSKAIYVECRNFNDYSRWKDVFAAAGFEYVPHLNFHVDTSSVEVVDANLGKSRKRDIRTTIREGVSVIEHPTDEQVCEYYKVLDNLYRTKVKTPLFPLSFFLALNKHKDGRLLLIEYQGRIIGGTVCVVFNRDKFETTTHPSVVYEWFVCGEDGVYSHVYPSSYATYAGIKYAAEHGCARFDMMGAGKPDKIGVLGVTILKKLK